MKSLISFISIVLVILLGSCSSTKDYSKRQFKNEAKRLKKEKYYSEMGSVPLVVQLEKAWQLEAENDTACSYLIVSAQSVAQTSNAAKQHALENAKLTVAGLIQSHIRGLVESDLSNKQLTREEARSIDKVVSAYTNVVAHDLKRVRPLLVLYREVGRDNIECIVRVAVQTNDAMDVTEDVVMTALEEETDVAREKLEDLMNIRRLNGIQLPD